MLDFIVKMNKMAVLEDRIYYRGGEFIRTKTYTVDDENRWYERSKREIAATDIGAQAALLREMLKDL